MSFMAVAVGASAVIGAGASIYAGSQAASAQRDATAANTQLQQDQTAEARRQYDLNRADLAPARTIGTGALYKLSNLMGVTPVGSTATSGTSSGTDWNGYLSANPDVAQAYASNPDVQAQFGSPEAYAQYHYATFGQNEGRALPTTSGQTSDIAANQNASETGALDKSFTLSDFQKDPGYQFRMDEGAKAVDNSAAARGGVLSGGAMKAMARYGQDFASNEYSNAYNRFNTDQTTRFNRLSSLAGTGQTATAQGITAANDLTSSTQTGTTNLISQNNAAANATASQYAGIGSAVSGAANTLGSYFAKSNAGSLNADVSQTIAKNQAIF
jgi:hypothetical protein